MTTAMSSGEPIVAIAWWQVREGALASVLALVAELRERSLAEPGCRAYEVLRSVSSSEAVVLIESYDDAAALEAHRSTQHYRELLVERILPMLTTRRVDLLRPADVAR